jgi:hypothetical protein
MDRRGTRRRRGKRKQNYGVDVCVIIFVIPASKSDLFLTPNRVASSLLCLCFLAIALPALTLSRTRQRPSTFLAVVVEEQMFVSWYGGGFLDLLLRVPLKIPILARIHVSCSLWYFQERRPGTIRSC